MEKPPIRKTRRALSLSKPAPRKNCGSDVTMNNNCTVMTEGAPSVGAITPEKQDKENITFKKRASRGLKLEKPAPLKSSKTNSAEYQAGKHDKVEAATITHKEDLTKETETICNGEVGVTMTSNAAEIKANLLIKEALSDLEDAHRNSNSPKAIQRQTRLLSQVSEDSGLGDMSTYSRQGSFLESLAENQDDLDWDDLDNTSPFTLGKQQLSCLPTTVNQMVPFNNFHTDNIDEQDINQKTVRQRKYSQQDRATKKPQFLRSYSVPSNLSRSKGMECWEDEIGLPKNDTFKVDGLTKNDMLKVETVKTCANEISSSNKGIMGSSVEQGAGEDMKEEVVPKHFNYTEHNHSKDKDSSTITPQKIEHSKPDVFPKPSRQVADDWEPEIVETEQEVAEMSEIDRPVTPVNVKKFFAGAETYSAIYNDGADLDATPKAGSVLSRYNDKNFCIKHFDKNQGNMAELYWESRCESAEDLKKEGDDTTVILNNCDVSIEMVKSLPSYQHYREKNDHYLSSSSRTSTETEDVISSSRSDDSFNEQLYAWELIEDLTSKVDSLNLGDQSPENGSSQNEVPDDVGILPDDIDDIEAELEFIREDLEQVETLKSDKLKYYCSMLKSEKTCNVRDGVIQVIREPLNPYTQQKDIWEIEKGMPTGFGSALSRRRMFRYYKESQIEEIDTSKDERLIQYTAKELLELGASALSKRKPESWSFLEHLYPAICLKKGLNLDTLMYLEEREFVCEVRNAENIDRKNSTRLSKSDLPDVSRPPPPSGVNKGGFGKPLSGFGVPHKVFGLSKSGFSESQNGFGKPLSGFGKPKSGFGEPQNGFDRPKREFGVSKSGFGVPQGGFGKPQSGFGLHQSKPEGGFGESKSGFGKPQTRNGESQGGFGKPQDGSDAPQSKFTVLPTVSEHPDTDFQEQRPFCSNEKSNVNNERQTIKQNRPFYGRSVSTPDKTEGNDDDLVLNKNLPKVCPW